MRRISWIKAAAIAFRDFPLDAQLRCARALEIAAAGEKADIAKPMIGLGAGVLEIALAFRGDAYRVVYAVQIGSDLWVVHAFQKKSTRGVGTPQHEVDLIKDRLKRLKELLG